jgi:hypothetical protein
MSFSFEKTFRTRKDARTAVIKDTCIPQEIKDLLCTAINGCGEDEGDQFIMVKACGHLQEPAQSSWSGCGSTIMVEVTPRRFD